MKVSPLVAIEALPDDLSSRDVWELLTEHGFHPSIVVTAPEADRRPFTLFLEFETAVEASLAMAILRENAGLNAA